MEQVLMRIGVSMSDGLLGSFDTIVGKRGYSSRSEGIRDAIRTYIQNYEWMSEVEGERFGLVTIIYESDKKGLVNQLAGIQRAYFDRIKSSVQIHLDESSIMELVIVRGDARDIIAFSEKVMAQKGVKYLRLTTVIPGAVV
jgi:CopG family transcriptional regulator, nickel-responsive regulator